MLTDSVSSDEAIRKIELFVNGNRVWLLSLGEQPIESTLNTGVTVGDSDAFAPSLDFGVDLF